MSFRLLFVILIAVPQLSVASENWLIKESKDSGIFAVTPIRISDNSIGGIEVRQIELYQDGKKIIDYGFQIRKDGETFKFNKDQIPRFYLRETGVTFNLHGGHSWACNESVFFSAVINGQQERVTPKYKGLTNFYPSKRYFSTKYINKTTVLGQTKISERNQSVEVWGLANSRENANKMAKWYEEQIGYSTYHSFKIEASKAGPVFEAGPKRLMNDSVTVAMKKEVLSEKKSSGEMRYTFWVNQQASSTTDNIYGNYRCGRERRGYEIWGWCDAGWQTPSKIDDRYLKAYVGRSQTTFFVQAKIDKSSNVFDYANVGISQCE